MNSYEKRAFDPTLIDDSYVGYIGKKLDGSLQQQQIIHIIKRMRELYYSFLYNTKFIGSSKIRTL